MKVLTWNVNRASGSRTGVWERLEQENADIVLLQEVTRIPDPILRLYGGNVHSVHPKFFDGHDARFQTAVLTKWTMNMKPYLVSELDWVNRIHDERYGWILGCEVIDDAGSRFRVVSVHAPAFHVPWKHLQGVDVSAIKLKNNPKLWFTEILWSLLQNADITDDTNWIVGGDFNSSVKFDCPRDRGNREIVDRMKGLGLTDGLKCYHGEPVPTFQQTSKEVTHQLDYVYVNAPLLRRLKIARVPNRGEVFDRKPRVSDHLPVVCEFA